MSDQQRLIIAITLSILIVVTWQHFFAPTPPMGSPKDSSVAYQNITPTIQPEDFITNRKTLIEEGIKNKTRIAIENQAVKGSINLIGARIDDLLLLNYRETINHDSPHVVLFSPSHTKEVYFSEVGWISNDSSLVLPNHETIWKADGDKLTANSTINLMWKNPQNIEFIISISLDENYMFTIKQMVNNNSKNVVKIQSYSLVSRSYIESHDKNMIIHEGAIGVFDHSLKEIEFEDLSEEKKIQYGKDISWMGFSDKYWLSALIPYDQHVNRGGFVAFHDGKIERFQADIVQEMTEIMPSSSASQHIMLFAGAKKLGLLDQYQEKYHIALFDRAVDFGILYFITKPIFLLLNYFHHILGNFGLAILLLTVVIKILLFPLAYKGFRGMNKIKDLQPQMLQLKQKYHDDPALFQKAMLELYKKEKVNPVAGCLPILLQMPIFFALYKVLYVTIEMRHAPFFGWIKNLSAEDPTNIFNLCGLIPWDPPSFLHIGILPVIMAFTMYIQQKLSPEPSDPVQAKVMKMLPWIFMFMFSTFPSGLVIYWAWSNMLSIIQQIAIKKLDSKVVIHKH